MIGELPVVSEVVSLEDAIIMSREDPNWKGRGYLISTNSTAKNLGTQLALQHIKDGHLPVMPVPHEPIRDLDLSEAIMFGSFESLTNVQLGYLIGDSYIRHFEDSGIREMYGRSKIEHVTSTGKIKCGVGLMFDSTRIENVDTFGLSPWSKHFNVRLMYDNSEIANRPWRYWTKRSIRNGG